MNEDKKEGWKEERLEIARKMLQLGTPLDVIEQVTGLTKAQILETKNNKEKRLG